MYFGGTIMTFALPMGAFIVIAVALFYLFRAQHSGPRLKYLDAAPFTSVGTREPGPVPAPPVIAAVTVTEAGASRRPRTRRRPSATRRPTTSADGRATTRTTTARSRRSRVTDLPPAALAAAGWPRTRPACRRRRTPRAVAGALVALTKPRIIELLLVTTVPTMLLAQRGLPSLKLVLVTLVGGTLAAGSANTINCYIDRDIDAVMKRTSRRPLVNKQGAVKPAEALAWGIVLGAGATAAARPGRQLAGRVPRRRRDRFLRLRLHAAAQAPVPGQHRDRRRGRLLPRARRLGGGQGHGGGPRDRAVRGDLPVDPAALLGAGDEVQGRLRAARTSRCSRWWPRPAAVTRKIVWYSYAMVAATLALAPYAGWLYTAPRRSASAAGSWSRPTACTPRWSAAAAPTAGEQPFPMRLFHL